MKVWVVQIVGDKVGKVALLVIVEQIGAEDCDDGDASIVLCVVVKLVDLTDDVCEGYAQDHAVDGPEALVMGVARALGDADVEEAGARAELGENVEVLGEGKVGLDRCAQAADGAEVEREDGGAGDEVRVGLVGGRIVGAREDEVVEGEV